MIRDTDRQIAETFEQTFAAAARNFEELVGDVFPGRQRTVAARARRAHAPRDAGRAVLGGQSAAAGAAGGEEAVRGRRRRGRRRRGGRARGGAGSWRGRAGGRDGRRDRDHARGQVDQAPVAALGRGEVDDRARVPVRRVPRASVPVLHPRRGRGGAGRPQPRPVPRAAAPLLRQGPVHRDHPSEAHDGGRGLAVRGVDGRRRRLQGALAPVAPRGGGERRGGAGRRRGGRRRSEAPVAR